ncbi:epiplakin, partial [Pseudonaja textilis]|uniref:epiplakin n=1 Tax=Pseudonaja textilis TaxID=8673 RepID=UPI000EA8835F
MRRCVADPARGLLLLPLKISFPGLRGAVCSRELMDSGVIDSTTFEALQKGEMTVQEVAEMDSVQQSTSEITSIAGVAILPTNERKSLYQALVEHLLPPGTAEILLQAQVASGYLIDPVKNTKLTVAEAIQAGIVGPELFGKLTSAERAVTGYKDPYTGETISLFQAMQKHLVPRNPGLFLLDAQLATGGIIDPHAYHRLPTEMALQRGHLDEETYKLLCNPTDEARGFFEPNSKEKLSYGELLLRGVSDPDTGLCLLPLADSRVTFEGLREKVTPAQLLSSEIINRDLFEKLTQGETLVKDVINMATVKKYLEGTGSIGGLLLPDSQERMSIYEAKRKGFLRPGTALILLEAQAATGHIIDPVANERYSVDEALRGNIIGPDVYSKLLAAEKAVTGYKDPYTGSKISLFQAMKKDLIVTEHAIRLLEAQIATGGIIDPVNSHRLPVEVAYKRGYFEKKMSLILSDPRDDTKGFFDPNTHENLTYLQLKEKCIVELTTGLCLLPLNSRKFTFKGLRKKVSASDLFQSQLIDKMTLDELQQGKTTVQEVSEMESVKRFLEGCNFIAGVLIEPDHEKMSLYQAMRRGLLRPGAALVLLEAQAATGYLIDPVKNKKLSVDEAMAAGLIGKEIYEKLLSAEKAVTGYTDPYTKGQISLFEAMNQELIVRSHGIRLMEAQIATGGIIDPVHSHRIPVEVAYKRGYFDEDLNRILLDPTDDTKGFFDPNTHENLTYLQLLERCTQDSETGLYMLQVVRKGESYFYIDEATKEFLKAQTMHVQVGRYKGQAVSLWGLLCSPYIHEQKRKDLVRQYKDEKVTLPQLCKTITAIVEETEQAAQKLKLKGLRGQEVSAAELFNAEIIDKATLDRLHQKTLPLQQLAQRDAVKRYLEGTGCIAGVLVAGQGLKLLAYEAMKRGFLSPEHTLLLLEAQAATGLLTDLLEKKPSSVDQAISLGLVGEEFHKALLLAEKAITGYTDPSTGDKLSLFQAMKRNLVEKAYALRLLEAQVATGGIIDPIHSHRLPVEVACRRGYLDEETCLLLSDEGLLPKGFVDPNTQERITYTQLLLRCTKDAKTGAYLLPLREKREYIIVDEQTKQVLSSCKIKVGLGKYRGQPISLWELLSSDYVTEEKKKEMIKKYKEGNWTVLQSITRQIRKIIEEREDHRKDIWFQGLRRQVTASELLKADIINEEVMHNLEAGTEKAQDVAKRDSVKRYLEGNSCIAGVLVPSRTDPSKSEKMTIYQAMRKGILRPGTALVLLEAQAATGFVMNPLKNERLSVSQAVEAGVVGEEIQKKLLCAEKAVTGYTDPNTGKSISLFQAMTKELILKEHGIRLLEAQIATGGIIDPVH